MTNVLPEQRRDADEIKGGELDEIDILLHEIDDSDEARTIGLVEDFLHANADLFADTNTRWREAARASDQIIADFNPLASEPMLQAQSRSVRRAVSGKEGLLKSSLIVEARQAAEKLSQTGFDNIVRGGLLQGPISTTDVEEYMQAVSELLDEKETGMPNMAFPGVSGQIIDTVRGVTESAATPRKALIPIYSAALMLNKVAIRKIEEIVEDKDAGEYFMSRILEMASNGAAGIEYPGLLEVLATDLLDRNGESIVGQLLVRMPQSPQDYSEQFITDVLASNEESMNGKRPKEVIAAFGVLRSMAHLFEDVMPMDQADFARLYATRLADWPKELQDSLAQYASTQRLRTSDLVKNALQPYKRPRRLTPDDSFQTSRNATDVHTMGPKADKRTKLKSKKVTTIGPEEAEVEPQPISKFAILKRTGSRNRVMRPEMVDGIDQLISHPVLQSYFQKYSHEHTLPGAILKVIEHITKHPFDKNGTSVLRVGNYSLVTGGTEKGHANRRLRRFKPTCVPDVHGEVAVQTRLFYDVINIGGQPTLAIYDIGIKQDVRKLDGSLSIR